MNNDLDLKVRKQRPVCNPTIKPEPSHATKQATFEQRYHDAEAKTSRAFAAIFAYGVVILMVFAAVAAGYWLRLSVLAGH